MKTMCAKFCWYPSFARTLSIKIDKVASFPFSIVPSDFSWNEAIAAQNVIPFIQASNVSLSFFANPFCGSLFLFLRFTGRL